MAIEFNGLIPASTARSNNKRVNADSADNQQPTAPEQTAVSANPDGIELSSQAQLLSKLAADVENIPAIDLERVEAIRVALNNGQFDIDDSSLAQRIIDFEFKDR
jgi:negative regulator of flagellin synthesis FlgM